MPYMDCLGMSGHYIRSTIYIYICFNHIYQEPSPQTLTLDVRMRALSHQSIGLQTQSRRDHQASLVEPCGEAMVVDASWRMPAWEKNAPPAEAAKKRCQTLGLHHHWVPETCCSPKDPGTTWTLLAPT